MSENGYRQQLRVISSEKAKSKMALCRYFRVVLMFTMLLIGFYIYNVATINLGGILEQAHNLQINISINAKPERKTTKSIVETTVVESTRQVIIEPGFEPIEVS